MNGGAAQRFLGWRVVAGSFGVLMLAFASAYGFPAFFDPLSREFPGSRGNISVLFAVCVCLFFTVGLVTGPWADRIGSRTVVSAGLVMIGLGLIAASFAQTLWQVLLAFGVGVGIGVGFAYVPSVSPVQRWFVRQRGRASGFAVTGIGVGTFLGPLAAAAIMEFASWRTAWLVIGIAVIGLGLLFAVWLIDSPDKVGQRPDGDPPAPVVAGVAPAAPPPGFTLKAALRARPFWIQYLAILLLSFPLFVPFVHLAPYAQDLGIGRGTAVVIASLIGIGSMLGRLGMGGLADRFGRRASLVAMYVGMAAMLAWWLVSHTAWQLAIFAVVFGACYGGFVALVPAVTIDYLGPRSAGAIIGALYTSVAPGALLGPPIAGYAFDALKSYTWPLVGAVACMALATVVMALAPPVEKWRAAQAR